MFERYLNNIWRAITYLIAAAFGALLVSLCFLDRLETDGSKQGKLYQLLSIIDQKFVEDVDRTALEDAAAEVRALQRKGLRVSAVFMGEDASAADASRIYGKNMARIRGMDQLARAAGRLIQNEIRELGD